MNPPTVFAAVDFSPVSSDVLATAVELARAIRGRLLLWHVVQIPASIVSFQMAGESVAAYREGAERDAEERVATLARGVTGVEVATGCSSGPPATEICREADAGDARFIVVGSHGHGSLYEFLIGTTTQGILKDAPCPVIVVPARARVVKRPPSRREAATA